MTIRFNNFRSDQEGTIIEVAFELAKKHNLEIKKLKLVTSIIEKSKIVLKGQKSDFKDFALEFSSKVGNSITDISF